MEISVEKGKRKLPELPMLDDKVHEQNGIKFKTHAIERPAGYRAQFPFNPRASVIGYTIGVKGATDLCKEFEYVDTASKMYLQIGIQEQQECISDGMALTSIDGHVVTVNLHTDKENGVFFVTIHSYDEKAMRKLADRFHKICNESNFYRGKHLMANDLDSSQPFTFAPPITEPVIYGFKDEQDSIHINGVRYFECVDIHKIAPQRGILLQGRPGSGKSLLVSKTKRECLEQGITVVEFTINAMRDTSRWYRIIEEWLAPALVVLEDVDLIGGSRDDKESPVAVTNDFLNSLGGNAKRTSVIVTMATTNRLESLDGAFLRSRRMDKIYEINGLAVEYKAELFRRHGVMVSEKALEEAVKELGPDTTGADVEEISVSCRTYQHCGEDVEKAFARAMAEWKKSHEALSICKNGVGFGDRQPKAARVIR